VPVICASDKTQLTNFSGDQHAWPLYLTIGTNQQDIRSTPKTGTWIPISLIPCPAKGSKIIEEAWHSAVGTVLSQLRHLDIAGPGLKWDCADGFQRQRYPLLAAWVRDHPQKVMVAQVSYSSCRMCEIPKGAPLGHSAFRPVDNWEDHHIHLELLEDINIDALQTLDVHPIHNQFWQCPLCIVYRRWQPDELHQLLLGMVKDLHHWLLKYLKARQVKDHFDKRFTSVPRYPGLRNFSKRFNCSKRGTWQGKEIRGMIRTLAVKCALILACTKDDRKTVAEIACDEMAMGAVGHYVNSLHLLANKITLNYPSKH